MKPIIERVFFRSGHKARPKTASSVSSTLTTRDIENYYQRVILKCLHRMLVREEDVQVRVKRTGAGPSGLTAFAGYVSLLRWDPVVTPVLLQNMPVIDARIRQVVGASVLLEHTHFDGLWFQATAGTAGSPTSLLGVPAELRFRARPARLDPPGPVDG